MDLTSTAQLLGSFGEFEGAIAVVATLAYLTIQVRQNAQVIRFQSGRESARLSLGVALALMQPAVFVGCGRISASKLTLTPIEEWSLL